MDVSYGIYLNVQKIFIIAAIPIGLLHHYRGNTNWYTTSFTHFYNVKHPALCLAGIIMTTICDIKKWSLETLRQIEGIGKGLYEDALLVSKFKNIEFTQMRQTQIIEMEDFKLHIECDNIVYDIEDTILNDKLMISFETSSTLCMMIDDTCLSLIANDGVFYIYDPNGVDCEDNKIRAFVSCFNTLESLTRQIIKVGSILPSTKFSINSIRVEENK